MVVANNWHRLQPLAIWPRGKTDVSTLPGRVKDKEQLEIVPLNLGNDTPPFDLAR